MVTGRNAPSAGISRLSPPVSVRERTRWLFGLLALGYLFFTVLPVLSSAHALVPIVGLGSAGWLVFSWLRTYLTGATPFAFDVLDAVAIFGIAVTSPEPASMTPLLFGVVWYQALYGSTRRSLCRCGMYFVAVGSSLAVWHSLPGNVHSIPSISVVGTFPFVLATVAAGRQLSAVLAAREASQDRSEVLANTGSQLLGITDSAAIRDLAWRALGDICRATPGLVLVVAVADGPQLRVERVFGCESEPAVTELAADTVDAAHPTAIRDAAPLNALVGGELQWRRQRVLDDGTRWCIFLGARSTPQEEVVLAVRSVINQLMLALRNSDRHQDLSTRARVDVLTGLVNRATFTTELTARLERDEPMASRVLFIDLDDFKFVNDAKGHQAGDAVLIEVASRIRECTRPADLCARLGGDEFAVLLPETSDQDATRVAERIVESVAEAIELGGAGRAFVGASIGIAAAAGLADIATVIHHADVAMYAAKALGKGRVEIFADTMLDADNPRKDFERRLATAVSAQEIVVHFQPIVSVADGICRAVEALVRWQHPERGLLEPADFLQIAERTGAISEIGSFVLSHSCQVVAQLNQSRPECPLTVHVNVCAVELEHEKILDVVRAALSDAGLPATQLVLELNDKLPKNSVTLNSRITALAELGVRIAIDDVGADHFPLVALRSLPIGAIKLDQSLLDSATVNPIDRAAVEAIVHMSAQLGIQTIVQGAERVDQQNFSELVGIDAVQGFLHLRPVPAPQLREWLGSLSGQPGRPDRFITSLQVKATA